MISDKWQRTCTPIPIDVQKELAHQYDNRWSDPLREWPTSVDFTEDQVRGKEEFVRILISTFQTREKEYTINPLIALSPDYQEYFELRQHITALHNKLHELEQRMVMLEEIVHEEEIVILRDIPREEAEEEIRALFYAGETLYYSDISERLGLDLELVVEICRRFQEEGEIEVSGDLL